VRVRFGLDVAQHQLTWEEFLARVCLAEEAGFEGAWVFDQSKNRLKQGTLHLAVLHEVVVDEGDQRHQPVAAAPCDDRDAHGEGQAEVDDEKGSPKPAVESPISRRHDGFLRLAAYGADRPGGSHRRDTIDGHLARS
jgi:hypothetical protein